MSITLYHGEPNGPSLTVLAALKERNIDAQLVHIDLLAGERHSRVPHSLEVDMSIEGEGPVLVMDGVAMADSVFIACCLDETGSGAPIRPANPYARWEMMVWCRQIIERCAPAAALLGARAYTHAVLAALDAPAFAALAGGIVSVDLRQRWQDVRDGTFAEEQVADSIAKIGQATAKCEAQLAGRDWLMGAFSIADLESFVWLAGMVDLVPQAFADKPLTTTWLARVRARPSVAWALGLATVAAPEQVWAPGPEINRWG